MTKCPKCLSLKIVGPFYSHEHGVERLNYRCIRCGYWSSTPTADDARVDQQIPSHRVVP